MLLLVSFQLNSNFVFCIALAVSYNASHYVYSGQLPRALLFKGLLIIAVSVASYMALRVSFTPSGMYAGYNSMGEIASVQGLKRFLFVMLRYLQYPLILGVGLLFAYVGMAVLARLGVVTIKEQGDEPSATCNEKLTLWWPIAISLFLIASAAFPYAVVGKPADLRALAVDWNPRHTYLMALPVALFLASFSRFLGQALSVQGVRAWWLPVACAMMCLGAILQFSFWHKIARSAYEQGVIMALEQRDAPKPGFVTFIAPNLPVSRMLFYDVNWLLYQAYGEENWFGAMVSSAQQPIVVPEWVLSDSPETEIYHLHQIQRDFHYECHTVLAVTGERYAMEQVAAWALFDKELPQQLSISVVSEKCPRPLEGT